MAEITERVRESFKEFDKNGDGMISREELMSVFTGDGWSKEDCMEMFKGVDANGDGSISLNEFVDWVMKAPASTEETKKDAEPAPPADMVTAAAVEVVKKAELREAAPFLNELFEKQKANYNELMNLPPEKVMEMSRDPEKAKAFQESQKKFIEEELKPLFDKSFAHHDTDGNKTLSKEEAANFFSHFVAQQGAFMEAMMANQIRHTMGLLLGQFKEMATEEDQDKLAELEKEAEVKVKESLAGIKEMLKGFQEEYKKDKAARDAAAFAVLDTDKDGTLVLDEIKSVVFPENPGDPRIRAFAEALGFASPDTLMAAGSKKS